MNSEVDINVLVNLYNKKLSALTNQNILLEAKIQTLTQEFEDEKNKLLAQLLELKKPEPVTIKSKSLKKDDDYQNSEVEE
jgi:hypothetical protein|tara:strand:+ start:103 stop:342 length:240 start_codon:yes stop_codon:yes gene_type:complete